MIKKLLECVEVPSVGTAFGGLEIHAIIEKELLEDVNYNGVRIWDSGKSLLHSDFFDSNKATRTPLCLVFPSSDS